MTTSPILETAIAVDSRLGQIIRVLHVDDDVLFLNTAKECLELQGGFQIETASSAKAAMERMRQMEFDVVISDYQMPEKDGLKFLTELRATGNAVPFILLTGKGREEVAVKALNLGAFRYLNKHGDPETVYSELASGIRQAFEQQHAQERLHESEEWFRAIHDQQQNGVIIIDPATHTIINANPAALEMTGATKEQLIGQVCHKFICPAEKGKCPVTDLGQIIDKSDRVLVKINSARMPILKAVKEVTIAGKAYLIESFIDITERKKIEEALEESQLKFMALFSENPEAVIFCNKDFRVVDVNPSFTAMFGYSHKEVEGKDLSEVIVPEKLKAETESIRKRLRESHVEFNTVRKRKDGSQVYVSLSGAPVVVNENVTGYVMVYKDISDLVFANEELSRMFEEMNQVLDKTRLLNEKLSVTGSLTRHDVRNKLAAITGYSYIAKKRLKSNDEVRNCLLQIDEVVKNIVRILDFAKAYEMLGSQDRVPMNVGKMVGDAASLFTDLKGVTVVNECSSFQVQADSLLMELWHNLIDNSLKYGEKITQIKVYTQENQDGTTDLIYEDDGVGIDACMKDMLFQKGFGKGTGYGLYLIRRICEMYGWTISEKGSPGEGVRFVINIPANSCGLT